MSSVWSDAQWGRRPQCYSVKVSSVCAIILCAGVLLSAHLLSAIVSKLGPIVLNACLKWCAWFCSGLNQNQNRAQWVSQVVILVALMVVVVVYFLSSWCGVSLAFHSCDVEVGAA